MPGSPQPAGDGANRKIYIYLPIHSRLTDTSANLHGPCWWRFQVRLCEECGFKPRDVRVRFHIQWDTRCLLRKLFEMEAPPLAALGLYIPLLTYTFDV